MALLKYAFLWLACAAAHFAMAQSGTLEVDLLFPRNGTWKPTAILPIVFGATTSVGDSDTETSDPLEI
jgi:hypothetical protein